MIVSTLYLASASPRRAELLQQLGLSFQIKVSQVSEEVPAETGPERMVEELALRKAEAVVRELDEGLVIGADTIVVLDGCILGKPADREDAARMLQALQGREHRVYTGVAVIRAPGGNQVTAVESTRVFFRPLTEEAIQAYIRSGEPLDKAGAYGIQGLGAVLVERIEGCYFNVVGLPLARLADLLLNFGVNLLTWEHRDK